jgi:hypothetical protein
MKMHDPKKAKTPLPTRRIVIYLIILGFLPSFFALFHYTSKKKEWEAVSERILSIQHLAETKARKQYLNTIVRNAYLEADQLYLENQLEPISFLKKEKETLEQLLKSPAFTGNEGAEKRYSFLSSKANRFQWVQGSAQVAEGVHEVTCLLSHPVEVDGHDLKEILTRIEGNRKGKPQLLITDFKLNRQIRMSGNEVFELNMKLLKREFHS